MRTKYYAMLLMFFILNFNMENKTFAQSSKETWEKFEFKGFKGEVQNVLFSKDGSLVYSLGKESRFNGAGKSLKAWNVSDGKEKFVIKNIGNYVLSRDSKMLITWGGAEIDDIPSDNNVIIWDAIEGKQLFNLGKHRVLTIEFSSNYKKVIGNTIAGDFFSRIPKLKIWNLTKNGEEIKSLDGTGIFDGTGKDILYIATTSNSIEILDSITLEPVPAPKRIHSGKELLLTKSFDGKKVVSVSVEKNNQSLLKVWDFSKNKDLVDEEKELFEFEEKHKVSSVIFSPDGKKLLTKCYQKKAGKFQKEIPLSIWNVGTGKKIISLLDDNNNQNQLTTIAFSIGDKIGIGREGIDDNNSDIRYVHQQATLKIIDLRSINKDIKIFTYKTNDNGSIEFNNSSVPIVFSPDGKIIASAHCIVHNGKIKENENPIELWDTEKGEKIFSFDGHGKVLPVGLDGGRRIIPQGADTAVSALAFNHDGTMLASGSRDGSIKLWEISPNKKNNSDAKKYYFKDISVFDKHQGYVTSTDLSRDGEKIVSADSKGFIRVWDPLSLKENLLIHAYGNKVTSVAFSPDGTRILSGGTEKETGRYSTIKVLKLWDSYSGKLLDSLNIEGGVNEPVAYSLAGTKIATGAGAIINDRWVNQIKIWDLKDSEKFGGVVLTINSVDNSDSLSFSPDGTKILSHNKSEREIKVCSTITGKRIGSITKISSRFNFSPSVNNFSPDGKKLLINDGVIKIYDVENCDLVLTINGTITAKAASFSNDGKCILSVNTDDNVFNKNPLYLKLWDSLNGNLVSSVNAENIDGPYTSLAFLKVLNNTSRIICWGRKNNDVGVFEIPFDFLPKNESSKPLKTPTPKMECPEITITGPRTFLYGDPINIKTKINDPGKVVGKIEYRVKLMDIQNNKQVFSLIHDWALFLIDKNTEFTNVPLKNYPAGSYILEIRATSDKGHLLTLSDYDFKISLPLNFSGKLQNNFGTFDCSIIIEDKPKWDGGIDPLFPFYSGSMTIVWSSKNEKRTETHPVHFVVSKDKYKIIGMGRFFRFHLTITDLEGPIVYEHGSVVLSNKLIKLYSSKN